MNRMNSMIAATVMMAAVAQSAAKTFGYSGGYFSNDNNVYAGIKKIKRNKKKKNNKKK